MIVLNNESLAILLHSSVQFSVRISHANLYISNFAGSSYLKNSDKSYLISFIVHGSGCKNLVGRFTMIPTLKRSAEPRNSNKSASVRERERDLMKELLPSPRPAQVLMLKIELTGFKKYHFHTW